MGPKGKGKCVQKMKNMSHLEIFQSKNGKNVHQHDIFNKADTKSNKIKNAHDVTA